MGEHRFAGYPSPADPAVHVALFALPHDSGADAEPRVLAVDDLGNEADVGFYHRVKPRRFPDEGVGVTDRLIQKCRDDFALPPALAAAEAFIEVNRKRREENHQQLAEILSRTSPEPLWSASLVRLPGAKQMRRLRRDPHLPLPGPGDRHRRAPWGWTWPRWRTPPCPRRRTGSSCSAATSASTGTP